MSTYICVYIQCTKIFISFKNGLIVANPTCPNFWGVHTPSTISSQTEPATKESNLVLQSCLKFPLSTGTLIATTKYNLSRNCLTSIAWQDFTLCFPLPTTPLIKVKTNKKTCKPLQGQTEYPPQMGDFVSLLTMPLRITLFWHDENTSSVTQLV